MKRGCGYNPPPLIGQPQTISFDVEIAQREVKQAFLDAIRYRGVGKWEQVDDDSVFKCSLCGCVSYNESKYCPDCGADMREVEE